MDVIEMIKHVGAKSIIVKDWKQPLELLHVKNLQIWCENFDTKLSQQNLGYLPFYSKD